VALMLRARWLIAVAQVLVLAGCGGSTATLGGKVTYQGKLVTSGSVIVVNDDGTSESAVIQPGATYTITGVKRGRVKIGVLSPEPARARSIVKSETPRPKGTGKMTAADRKAIDAGWFPVPREYGNPATSGVGCDVTASRVQFDIDLK
jgi:hypothetical protein